VVADSHHFDDEQDPHPQKSKKLDPDSHKRDADPQPCLR
jgi:hypothetical protein